MFTPMFTPMSKGGATCSHPFSHPMFTPMSKGGATTRRGWCYMFTPMFTSHVHTHVQGWCYNLSRVVLHVHTHVHIPCSHPMFTPLLHPVFSLFSRPRRLSLQSGRFHSCGISGPCTRPLPSKAAEVKTKMTEAPPM